MSAPLIGVLALQGAFREHGRMLRNLGADVREIRKPEHLSGIDAAVLPGGESTTIGKLLTNLHIMEPLKDAISHGMPVFGTCAGLILLCREIEGSDQPRLGLMDAKVRRNAFGRQVDSFEAPLSITGLDPEPFPGVFIRAPVILDTGPDVQSLAHVLQDGAERPVAIRQGHMLGASFHPELTEDDRIHRSFLKMCGYKA